LLGMAGAMDLHMRQWARLRRARNAARGLMSVASRRSQRAARPRSARRWSISSQPR
jgi:predicted nucleotidyltransferase